MELDTGTVLAAVAVAVAALAVVARWEKRDRLRQEGKAVPDRHSVGEKYHVFLSFRGPDTREGFADFLFVTLKNAGLRVFMDDEEIRKGDAIGEKIHQAIYDSKIFLPVFSEGYATSKWCLKEIKWMTECMDEFPGEKELLPVFYHVRADDVKLKTKMYTKALKKHEKTIGHGTVEGWRKALKKVPQLKGWNLPQGQGQGKLSEQITQDISRRLHIRRRELPDHFIGVEDQVGEVVNLLDCGSKDVRIVVIHGMGGTGKTTLANVLFNKISGHFRGCSFLSNVRESSAGNGIVNLQNKLLNDVFKSSSSNFQDANDAMNCIKSSFRNRDVIAVLDDVSDNDQIQKLVGMGDYLGLGSRVVITTRNSGCVANIDEVKNNRVILPGKQIYIYPIRELNDDDSLKLLSLHAFGQDAPPGDYKQQSRDILSLTKGVPLAIEVIGSQMRGSSVSKWEAMLDKLKKVPHECLYRKILMSSYEMLDEEEKEIFRDIACIMDGEDKTKALYYWEAGGLSPRISLDQLVSYALVKIVGHNRLWMHDLLKDFGREADRKQSNGNRRMVNFYSRREEAKSFLQEDEGTKHVQALALHDYILTPDELKRLPDLKLLVLRGGGFTGNFKDGCLSKLRWLSCLKDSFGRNAMNLSFENLSVEKLAVLSLSLTSDIDETWEGWEWFKRATSLKCLELDGISLTKTPDFSSFPRLERLVVRQNGPFQIDDSIGKLQYLNDLELVNDDDTDFWDLPISIFQLKALWRLVLGGFELDRLPENIGELRSLKILEITWCVWLCNLPDSIGDLESLRELRLSWNGITELPESIGHLGNLTVLDVSHNKLNGLPSEIGDLVRLEELNVSGNRALKGEIPSELDKLESLRSLDLSFTDICRISARIDKLTRLESLNLEECRKIQEVPDLPMSLTRLKISSESLEAVPELSRSTNLVKICGIQKLEKLEELSLKLPPEMMPNDFSLSLEKLSRLKYLRLRCENASGLNLPSGLDTLELIGCGSKFPWECISQLRLLSKLEISESSATEIRLNGLEWPNNLIRLKILRCDLLESVDDISGLEKLEDLEVYYCPKLVEIGGLAQLQGLQPNPNDWMGSSSSPTCPVEEYPQIYIAAQWTQK